MSEYVLAILAQAKDEASGVLGNVHGALGGIGKVMGGALAVGAGVAVAGIGALTAVLADSVREAMAAEGVQADLNATLASTKGIAGMTAQAANDLATGLSEVTRFEDDSILSGENMLLTFTNIGADVFPMATEAMLNMAQKMGGDASSQALLLGKALNDPIAGLGALKRVGVAFTDAQEEMIKKMAESGDVAGAQKMILGELNKEFGGLAVAAGQTAAGQMDIFNNKIGNMKEEVGTALMPALTSLMTVLGPPILSALQGFAGFLTDTVIPAIISLSTWITEHWPEIQATAEQVFGAVRVAVEQVSGFIQTSVVPVLSDLATWLQVNLPPALQFLADTWNNVLLPAITAVWNFIQTYVVPILSTLFTWLQTTIPPALQFLADTWNNVLLPAITAVWNFIQTYVVPILSTLFTWLQTTIPPALQFLANVWNNVLLPAITAIWSFISTKLAPLFKALVEVDIAVLKLAVTALAGLWQNVLLPALTAIWQFINEKVIPIFAEIVKVVRETLGPALRWLKDDILAPLARAFDKIGDAISGVISWISNLANKLGSIDLPDWLTPGSPTPFELGLLGIVDALKQVADTDVPLFGAKPGLAYATAGGSSSSYVFNVTVNATGNAQGVAAAAESGVLRAARALGMR